MPFTKGKDSRCPPNKPIAVKKQDGSIVPGGCHADDAEAQKHLDSLQANSPESMKRTEKAVRGIWSL